MSVRYIHTILEVLERHGNSLCLSDHFYIQTVVIQSTKYEINIKKKVRNLYLLIINSYLFPFTEGYHELRGNNDYVNQSPSQN